jgi:hypothetical protein
VGVRQGRHGEIRAVLLRRELRGPARQPAPRPIVGIVVELERPGHHLVGRQIHDPDARREDLESELTPEEVPQERRGVRDGAREQPIGLGVDVEAVQGEDGLFATLDQSLVEDRIG